MVGPAAAGPRDSQRPRPASLIAQLRGLPATWSTAGSQLETGVTPAAFSTAMAAGLKRSSGSGGRCGSRGRSDPDTAPPAQARLERPRSIGGPSRWSATRRRRRPSRWSPTCCGPRSSPTLAQRQLAAELDQRRSHPDHDHPARRDGGGWTRPIRRWPRSSQR